MRFVALSGGESSVPNYGYLQRAMVVIGFFLVGLSLYCSFMLYTSFGEGLLEKMAWGGMGLGLDAFKNVALLVVIALWGLGYLLARLMAVFVGLVWGVLTVISFMAFFGFMSQIQHNLQKEAYLASAQHRHLEESLAIARGRVEQLRGFADKGQMLAAQAQVQGLQLQIKQLEQEMGRFANADCSPKQDARGNFYTSRALDYCNRLNLLRAEVAKWDVQVSGYGQYEVALVNYERLLAERAGSTTGEVAVGDSYVHPMFVDLGVLLAQTPDEVKVIFMFVSSVSAEILGTLSILIASLLGRTRRRSLSLEELAWATEELRAQQVQLQQLFTSPPSAMSAGGEGKAVEASLPHLKRVPLSAAN